MKKGLRTFLFVLAVIVLCPILFVSYVFFQSVTVDAYSPKAIKRLGPENIAVFDKDTGSFEPVTFDEKEFLMGKPNFKATPNNDYFLSIIVPAHNVVRYLPKCLNSILEQEHSKKYEIILVENDSSDSSLDMALDYAKSHDEIVLIKQNGGGLPAARNVGAWKARGKYITFLDSDDWLESGALKIMEKSALNDDIDVIFFGFNFVDDVSRQTLATYTHPVEEDRILNFSDFGRLDLNNKMFNAVWGRMYRRDSLMKNGLFFYHSLYHEDTLFDLIMFSHPLRFKVYKDIVLNYRINRDGSIMSKGPYPDHIIAVFDIFSDYLKSRGLFDQYKNVLLDYEIHNIVISTLYKLDLKSAIAYMKYLKNRYSELDYLPYDSRHVKYMGDLKKEKFIRLWILKMIPKKIGEFYAKKKRGSRFSLPDENKDGKYESG